MLKMNKEKFLKTEFGSSLEECITAWDHWLAELKEFRFEPHGEEYKRARESAGQCQAQWQMRTQSDHCTGNFGKWIG